MARYERKLILPRNSLSELNSFVRLHPARFRPLYQPRHINNIYFDTPLFRNFHDSTEGFAQRNKIRIRWYGNLFGEIANPKLELKDKTGVVGTKANHVLPILKLNKKHVNANIETCLKVAKLPDDVLGAMMPMQPALMNRYLRSYWRSADGNYRLTVDSELQFTALQRVSGAGFQTRRDHRKIIVEMKYDAEFDSGAPEITQYFPVRLGKCSKYVMGIERLYRGYAEISPD